ncbi:MAG: PIN domain-containing protein [Propionibacteriaceae bacterium]|nr:PIN domain-containing protein [Propionibacteriaceae bacterium]
MIILDACVLAAFADANNTHHDAAISIMATIDQFAISALTGAEVMVQEQPEAAAIWENILTGFGIRVIDLTAADKSPLAAIRRETRLKMPDAVVVYAAHANNATIATFDERLTKAAHNLGITTHPI